MKVPLKRASTFFLRAAIAIMALVALALCIFLFPNVLVGAPEEWPAALPVLYIGFIGIYLTIIPFLFALYQALKLLRYIDTNNAFSESSINALRSIKFSAITMTLLYLTAMPLAYVFAELDDAPGVIVISFAFACAPLVVATFAAVLQKLVQNALDMKMENDLTI